MLNICRNLKVLRLRHLSTSSAKTTLMPLIVIEPKNSMCLEVFKEENELFRYLISVRDHFALTCTPRVAGGWVRDGLLERPRFSAPDIDIALDTVSGVEFANFVADYAVLNDAVERPRVGVVRANPELSKHLETAKVVLLSELNDRSKCMGSR